MGNFWWAAVLVALVLGCGKGEDGENSEAGCEPIGCACSDGTQGLRECMDDDTHGACMCTTESTDTFCCVDRQFFDCPSILTADSCYETSEAGACVRDPAGDTRCTAQNNASNRPDNNTSGTNGETDDPLCWANCSSDHETCAQMCGGGETCWDTCTDDHAVCAVRCGGGQTCFDECDAPPVTCDLRCG